MESIIVKTEWTAEDGDKRALALEVCPWTGNTYGIYFKGKAKDFQKKTPITDKTRK